MLILFILLIVFLFSLSDHVALFGPACVGSIETICQWELLDEVTFPWGKNEAKSFLRKNALGSAKAGWSQFEESIYNIP